MSEIIEFTIDGQTCKAKRGALLVNAAADNGIFIPTLCNYPNLPAKGSCRICSVRVNGRLMTACVTPVVEGMVIENDVEDIQDLRKSIIELIFTEGNHYCPSCEKSGDCELQALAYRFGMLAPRFPYTFPRREVDASNQKLIKEQNRCILCKRCVRGIQTEDGRNLFAVVNRGHKSEVVLDKKLGAEISDEKALEAMNICPVGSILVKEKGFKKPIGKRKYDLKPIGSNIENKC
jgi:[NiFe] hydrogenase diaphorase moiety small subunit